MKSAVICMFSCVLFGTLICAVPLNTDRSQQLMDHLANLKAHAQSPLVKILLEAVMENTEDVNVAVFVQDLLDSRFQDVTVQDAVFGRKEAEAAFATFQSLPVKAKIQVATVAIVALITIPIVIILALILGGCYEFCSP